MSNALLIQQVASGSTAPSMTGSYNFLDYPSGGSGTKSCTITIPKTIVGTIHAIVGWTIAYEVIGPYIKTFSSYTLQFNHLTPTITPNKSSGTFDISAYGRVVNTYYFCVICMVDD